jgi:hypothetical protein
VVIPGLQKLISVFLGKFEDSIQCRAVVTSIIFNLNGLEPNFRNIIVFDDVDMRRFIEIGRVETELVALNVKGRHGLLGRSECESLVRDTPLSKGYATFYIFC